jgi:hypothetical protein
MMAEVGATHPGSLQQSASAPPRSAVPLMRLAWQEAEKHKWIESEKAGRDLGADAIRDWSRKHFHRWCRERWIEHLLGTRYWGELDHEDFGLLRQDFHPNTRLVRLVTERIQTGGENLDILQWVVSCGENLHDTLEILWLLDINSRRLDFQPALASVEHATGVA